MVVTITNTELSLAPETIIGTRTPYYKIESIIEYNNTGIFFNHISFEVNTIPFTQTDGYTNIRSECNNVISYAAYGMYSNLDQEHGYYTNDGSITLREAWYRFGYYLPYHSNPDSIEMVEVPSGQPLPTLDGDRFLLQYVYGAQAQFIVSSSCISETIYGQQKIYTSVGIKDPNHPSYKDLLDGYYLDNRAIPDYPTIELNHDADIKICYYKVNRLEPIPSLSSIDWFTYNLNIFSGVPITLPIKDCVLGTLYIDNSLVLDAIQQIPVSADKYDFKYLLPENIDSLFSRWTELYESDNINTGFLIHPQTIELRKLAANNNIWNILNLSSNLDINFDINHRMMKINYPRQHEWHIDTQTNNSGIGNLIMDSPRTIEIHRALNAGKWGVNTDDPTVPRLINLGWFIEKIAWFFGIRPKPDGKIDKERDKRLVRTVIDKTTRLDPDKIGVNSFGEDGMVITRINNRFKNKDIVSDQCVIVKDFIQLIQEYFEQNNLALGIQESSAIEIKRDETTARFNNQLEILVELVNLMSSGNEMIRANLVSSLVTQSQSNEIIAGLGLPSVTKSIPLKMDDKIYHLPYKGIAAHRSISQEIATCTYNVGLVTGQLL